MDKKIIAISNETYQMLLEFKLDNAAKLRKDLTFDEAVQLALNLARKVEVRK